MKNLLLTIIALNNKFQRKVIYPYDEKSISSFLTTQH